MDKKDVVRRLDKLDKELQRVPTFFEGTIQDRINGVFGGRIWWIARNVPKGEMRNLIKLKINARHQNSVISSFFLIYLKERNKVE